MSDNAVTSRKQNGKKGGKKTWLWVLIVMVLVLLLVILFSLGRLKSVAEEKFDSLQVRLSNEIVPTAYKRYVSGTAEEYYSTVEKINGGALTDEEKELQMKLYITKLSGRINTGTIVDGWQLGVTDDWSYYDEDMNNYLPTDNDILLYTRVDEEDNNGAKLFYIFDNEEFGNAMEDIKEKYSKNMGDVFFHIQNIYIRDNEFIPEKLEYFTSIDGEISDTVSLFETEKTREEMEADGYTFVEIEDQFFPGYGESVFDYIACSSDSTTALLEGYLKEYKDAGKPATFRKNLTINPLYFEAVEIRECIPEGSDKAIYVVTYQRSNVLLNLIDLFS